MTENLENTVEATVETTETPAEQGTVVENTVDTAPVADTTPAETEPTIETGSETDLNKVEMRKNQLENQAKKIEEATGMKLEDLIVKLGEQSEPVATTDAPTTEDIDMDRFTELTDLAVKAKYGDKFARLDRMDEYFAKLEAKELVSQLPSDYKEYEPDMMEFISKNNDIMKTKEGVMTAYYAAKGKNLDKIVKSAEKDTTAKLNETEELKNVAFVENAKNSDKEEKVASLKEISNLSLEEYNKLPKEIRDKILQ